MHTTKRMAQEVTFIFKTFSPYTKFLTFLLNLIEKKHYEDFVCRLQ